MKIDYVLVPADFSTSSRAALGLASSLGEAPPRVRIAHVVDTWPPYMQRVLFPYAPLGEDDVAIQHELELEAAALLREHLRLGDQLPAHLEEPVVESGRAKELLGELARRHPADLVVMGAFGEGGSHPGGIGSVAERMARTSRQPVILVRDFDPNPRIEKILVAVDLSPGSAKIVQAALAVAMRCGASLELIYVFRDPSAGDSSDILGGVLRFDARKAVKQARDRIEAHFERLIEGVEVAFSEKEQVARLLGRRKIAVGTPADVIVERAVKTGADLVVVGSQDAHSETSSRLGHVASAVVRNAPTHVMVVPVEKARRVDE